MKCFITEVCVQLASTLRPQKLTKHLIVIRRKKKKRLNFDQKERFPLYIPYELSFSYCYGNILENNIVCIQKVSNETTAKYKSCICEALLDQYIGLPKLPSDQEFIHITCL